MSRRVVGLALACAAAVAALPGCGGGDAAARVTVVQRVVPVRARKPVRKELPITLSYPAEVGPIQTADIKSVEARGFIRQIFVDRGDHVKKGQVLVTVDCPDFRSRRVQAEADLRSVGATRQNAKRILERLAPMRAERLIAPQEIDNAQAGFDAADARVRGAEAKLSEVNEVVGYCTMRAPFAGEVSARHRDPGAQVRPGGRPILTLMRIDAVRVSVNVVERDASYVKVGLPATLRLSALPGRVFEGKVTRFVNGFDPRTRTLLTEVELHQSEEGLLKPGMFGRLQLVVERRPNTILVPHSAVLTQECATSERQQCSWVYVVKDGLSHRVEVQVGYDTGEEVEVRRGLSGDELVIVSGRDLVADGTPVKLVQ